MDAGALPQAIPSAVIDASSAQIYDAPAPAGAPARDAWLDGNQTFAVEPEVQAPLKAPRRASLQKPAALVTSLANSTATPHRRASRSESHEYSRGQSSEFHSKVGVTASRRLAKAASSKQLAKAPPPKPDPLNAMLESRAWTAITVVGTLYALFADDFRVAAVSPAGDDVFYGIACFVLFIFLAELVLAFIAKPEYRFKFYFWLDLLAAVSLIPDIGWIWNAVLDSSSGGGLAERASRVSTKAGRIIRIVRLVRLIRIAKLCKQVERTSQTGEKAKNQSEPSKLGKHLTDLTVRRVTTLVIAMILVLPFLDSTSYSDGDKFAQQGLIAHHRLVQQNAANVTVSAHLSQYMQEAGDVLLLNVHGVSDASMRRQLRNIRFTDDSGATTLVSPSTGWSYADLLSNETEVLAAYRTSDLSYYDVNECYTAAGVRGTSGGNTTCISFVFLSLRESNVLDAILSICKTFFIMAVLGLGAFLFTQDAELLVIRPIERMVQTVKALASNPLGALMQDGQKSGGEDFETSLLENTLGKIGTLLQLGFGQAGTEIIRANMAGGELNPLLEGNKIYGIFGFCDIRQFTDITECLEREVMIFVNRVADIVHYAVCQYCGAPNKNIGDAFLLVWRFPNAKDKNPDSPASAPASLGSPGAILDLASPPRRGSVTGGGAARASNAAENTEEKQLSEKLTPTEFADNALFAFLKIIVDIEIQGRIPTSLGKYKNVPSILNRFGPSFTVRLGYGLHYGWAIEGAIGSLHKIDASYLSPHVNIASRLEAATKQYNVPLLVSGDLISLCSSAAKRLVRRVDRVTVKGSVTPLDLFTVDITNTKMDSFGDDTDVDEEQSQADFSSGVAQQLQDGLHPQFIRESEQALIQYLNGNWPVAEARFRNALQLKPDDGPINSILEFMQQTYFVAPQGWAGCRALTEK